MSDGSLNFDTKINEKGFEKGAAHLNNSLKSIKSSLTKIGGLVAAAFSVKAIVGFAKESESLYNTQISQEVKLETVMRQRMQATDESIQGIKDYVSQLQQLGVIGDEVQLAGAQQVATFLTEADSLKTLIPAMNNLLAQQRGLEASTGDAVNIANLMGKVMQGQTSALKRVGISFSAAEEQVLKYGTESERAAMLAQVITNNVGDMNAALAKTSAGRQKQLANTIGDLKEQFGEATSNLKMAFLPALELGVKALEKLAVFAKQASATFAEMFGFDPVGEIAVSSSALASSADLAADSYSDMADSATEAAKANQKSLASFDKVNKLGDNSSAAGSTPASTGGAGGITTKVTAQADVSETDSRFSKFLDDLKSKLNTIFDPFKAAWESKGTGVISSAKTALSSLKDLASSVGRSLVIVWSNGSGQATLEHILSIYTSINTTVGNIAANLSKAWKKNNTGTNIVQNLSDAFNTLLGHIDNVSQDFAEWSEDLDFSPILESIEELTDAFEPLADTVGDSLEDLFSDFLEPLASWTIEEAAPAAIEAFSSALTALDSAIDAIKPLGEWLWNSFLSPIAGWTGGVVVDIINKLADVLTAIGDWISQHKEAVQDMVIIFASLWAGFKAATLISAAATAFSALGGAMGIATVAATALDAALAVLLSPVTLIAVAIGSVIAAVVLLVKHWDELKANFQLFCKSWKSGIDAMKQTVTGFVNHWISGARTITSGFVQAWDSIKRAFSTAGSFFAGVWENIKKPFSDIAGWFRQKFTAAWSAVKNVFSSGGEIFEGIKDGILDGLKAVINALIDGINKVISIPFNGINTALKKIKDISFLGLTPFDWIKTIDIPQIPKLAKGTVVPPNSGEFMAILGDNKRETEVVSPESTMIAAFKKALAEMGRDQGGDINMTVYLDSDVVYRKIVKRNRENTIRTGKNALA